MVGFGGPTRGEKIGGTVRSGPADARLTRQVGDGECAIRARRSTIEQSYHRRPQDRRARRTRLCTTIRKRSDQPALTFVVPGDGCALQRGQQASVSRGFALSDRGPPWFEMARGQAGVGAAIRATSRQSWRDPFRIGRTCERQRGRSVEKAIVEKANMQGSAEMGEHGAQPLAVRDRAGQIVKLHCTQANLRRRRAAPGPAGPHGEGTLHCARRGRPSDQSGTDVGNGRSGRSHMEEIGSGATRGREPRKRAAAGASASRRLQAGRGTDCCPETG